jgi:nucleotide-binding universal stress UspA family protein
MTHLLVGVDGTAAGDAALLWSLREAARDGGTVTAINAWQPAPVPWDAPGMVTGSPYPERVAADLLDAAVKNVLESGGADGVDLRTQVVCGPAAMVLVENAQDVDLLVVGRRHESALARAALGSVSSAALHHAPCPVAVVPAAWNGSQTAGRVVVGVDETDAADAALRWAARRAHRDGSRLVPVRAHGVAIDGPAAPDLRELEGTEASRLIRRACEAAGAPDLDVQPQICVGLPATVLRDAAGPGDLLVVGSRGRSRLAGWLLGSTSASLVHHSDVPVVVVREPHGGAPATL